MKTEKLNLRERIKQALKDQNQDKHYCNFQSQKALIKLYNFDLFKKASCVLAFFSYGNEIKTGQLLDVIFNEKKKLCIPRTENNEMDFYFLNQEKMISEQTEVGEYNVTVPLSTLEKFDVAAIPENTIVLVPGLAFDRKGNRLGKGKGYYDRFLEKLLSSPTKENILGFVGYCYDFQIIEKVITEENDIPVNYVVSDQNIIEISN